MDKKLAQNETKNFRYNFRALRIKRGEEQKEIAAKMGISQQDVSALEKGRKRVTAAIVDAAAEALRTTPDDLLGEVPTQAAARDIAARLFEIAEKLCRVSPDPVDLQLIAKSVSVIETIIGR